MIPTLDIITQGIILLSKDKIITTMLLLLLLVRITTMEIHMTLFIAMIIIIMNIHHIIKTMVHIMKDIDQVGGDTMTTMVSFCFYYLLVLTTFQKRNLSV